MQMKHYFMNRNKKSLYVRQFDFLEGIVRNHFDELRMSLKSSLVNDQHINSNFSWIQSVM